MTTGRSEQTGNLRDAISAAIRTFPEAFKNEDPSAITALYADDATLLPPGEPLTTGRDAIQAFWQGAMKMGVKEASLETISVESRDDLAYEIGRFTMTVQPAGGEKAEMRGKYVVVWKHISGTWRMHVDIWNSDETP